MGKNREEGAEFLTIVDDQQRPRGACDVAQSRQHSRRGGGCEDVAAHRRCEHARAHEPRVRRLVPRPAACGRLPATVACLPLPPGGPGQPPLGC